MLTLNEESVYRGLGSFKVAENIEISRAFQKWEAFYATLSPARGKGEMGEKYFGSSHRQSLTTNSSYLNPRNNPEGMWADAL